MGMKKQAAGLLMALVLAFAGSVGTLAAQTQTYQETVLTLPAEIMPDRTDEEVRIQSLSAHGDRLDLFAEWQPNAFKFITRHFQSLDGGKSWKEQDTSWMNTLGADQGSQPYTWVDADGTIYALLFSDSPEVKLPTVIYHYNIAILAAHKDGKTRVITKLDNKDYGLYWASGVSRQGELLLEVSGVDLGELAEMPPVEKYLVIDVASGQVKHEVDKADPQAFAVAYEDGLVMEARGDGKHTFIEAATGKIKQTVASAEGVETCCTAGSKFYSLTDSGLYRFQPGETALTKILDSSIRKHGTAGSNESLGRGLAVDEDGSIYVLMKHLYNDGFRFPVKGWTLSRYTPA